MRNADCETTEPKLLLSAERVTVKSPRDELAAASLLREDLQMPADQVSRVQKICEKLDLEELTRVSVCHGPSSLGRLRLPFRTPCAVPCRWFCRSLGTQGPRTFSQLIGSRFRALKPQSPCFLLRPAGTRSFLEKAAAQLITKAMQEHMDKLSQDQLNVPPSAKHALKRVWASVLSEVPGRS